MDTMIRISLALRLAALFALPAGILTAVILQRSPAIVLVFALAMIFVRPLVLRITKSRPPAWPSLNRFATHFTVLAIFGGILFVTFAGIGTLFTGIDLRNQLTGTDFAIVLIWAAIGAACHALSIRLMSDTVEAGMYEMRLGPFGRGPFGFGDEPTPPADQEGEIIEGEVIDPDEQERQKR